MLETPILFLIFNRPDTTEKVFQRIKEIRPKYFFIAADGGRNEHEKIICQQTRDLVIQQIDWDCDVKTLFREKNLGCGLAVSGAISWFFQNVEQGIILEDDCYPDMSFFPYCEMLLNQYKSDMNIWHIGGNNFQNSSLREEDPYYFSMYTHIWGWATWKNRWEKYRFDISTYDLNQSIPPYSKSIFVLRYFQYRKKQIMDGKINTWDYQFNFSMWENRGLSIIPNKNLVSNIGFGDNATNTRKGSSLANMPTFEFDIENKYYSKNVFQDKKADQYTFKNIFMPSMGLLSKFKSFLYISHS